MAHLAFSIQIKALSLLARHLLFIKVLQDNDIKISMDGKGCWVDNVFIERLWRSVKQVICHQAQCLAGEQLREELLTYCHLDSLAMVEIFKVLRTVAAH